MQGARQPNRPHAVKVAIIGGGVMGCASALALRARGAEVVLLERAVPGAEASSAAAGVLGAQVESGGARAMLPMFVRARAEYAAWAAELRDATGIDIGHRVSGLLHVARTDAEHATLRELVAWQTREGLRAELLDAAGARSIEPELDPASDGEMRGAAYFPDESQVDPPALLRALGVAVARAKVDVRRGATVEGLLIERDRCVGARLEDGDIRADATVLAAGSWSSLVPGVPAALPKVRPARGQIVQLEERPPRARTIVFGAGAYLVPRGDGRVICGSTLEFVGYQRAVTAGGVSAILNGVLALVPSLASAEVSATWSNFRPYLGSNDAPPLIGASPLAGLILATGHHRNGILLAKLTGTTVAEAVFGAR